MKAVLQRIASTQAGITIALMRVVLGVIFFTEGSKKLFGWFGGGGWASTCAFFANLGIPFPGFNAALVGIAEFAGGIALFVGLLTRLAAIPIGFTMVIAIATAHLGGGWHYPLVILVACMVLVQEGGGSLSLDRSWSK
jgi:putative oxidoreductase